MTVREVLKRLLNTAMDAALFGTVWLSQFVLVSQLPSASAAQVETLCAVTSTTIALPVSRNAQESPDCALTTASDDTDPTNEP